MVPILGAGGESRPDPQPPIPTLPVRPGLARSTTVGGDRAGWVTADDYPGTALRQEAEGIVGINVTIAADGRVTACEVTQPSGNASLDQATCGIYAHPARASPRRGTKKVARARRGDRVRWRPPAQ